MEDNVKKYVDKVVDRIVSDTQISKRKAQSYILTPFSERVFSAHEFSEGKDLNTRYSSVSALSHYFSLFYPNNSTKSDFSNSILSSSSSFFSFSSFICSVSSFILSSFSTS